MLRRKDLEIWRSWSVARCNPRLSWGGRVLPQTHQLVQLVSWRTFEAFASWITKVKHYHYASPILEMVFPAVSLPPRPLHSVHQPHKAWNKYLIFFFPWRCGPTRTMASSFLRFLHHTRRRTTVRRTPVGERSARRRNLSLTINTHNRQTSVPPARFEPTTQQANGRRPTP